MAGKGDYTQRELAILEEIIRHYMATREAISARTLSKISALALSPTTIRNLMEDLSAEGFLTTEGVTRGRIPTQKAFAIHITRLDDQHQPAPRAAPDIPALEEGQLPPLEGVLERLGRYLAERTGCAVTALLPPRDAYPLNLARFSPLPGGQVLVTVQTLFGDLWSKVLVAPHTFPDDLLRDVGRFVSDTFRGKPMTEVRSDIMSGEPKELLEEMPSLGAAFRMLRRAFEWPADGQRLVWGFTNLIHIPECNGPRQLALADRMLAQREFIQGARKRGRGVGGGWIALGNETGHREFEACAMVGYPFGWEQWRGELAVLGPMRMDYGAVLALTAQCAGILKHHLDETVRHHGYREQALG